MGFLFGQLSILALSLMIPAAMNMIPNNQKFHQRIFFGFSSTCGILLRLRLVATPPITINKGKITGDLKKKYVSTEPIIMMIQVMVFLTECGKALIQAYTRNPAAIGGMNLKISLCNAFLSK